MDSLQQYDDGLKNYHDDLKAIESVKLNDWLENSEYIQEPLARFLEARKVRKKAEREHQERIELLYNLGTSREDIETDRELSILKDTILRQKELIQMNYKEIHIGIYRAMGKHDFNMKNPYVHIDGIYNAAKSKKKALLNPTSQALDTSFFLPFIFKIQKEIKPDFEKIENNVAKKRTYTVNGLNEMRRRYANHITVINEAVQRWNVINPSALVQEFKADISGMYLEDVCSEINKIKTCFLNPILSAFDVPFNSLKMYHQIQKTYENKIVELLDEIVSKAKIKADSEI